MFPRAQSAVPSAAVSDAELVAACLAGERDAFRQIVERYQRLLCSLAYSATGDVSASEDLAQEAFIEAWGALDRLREPEKLRAWLCGIVRHKVSHLRRRAGRDVAFGAEPLEAADEVAGEGFAVVDQTIRNEEQALLRHALERVPPLYREPLVLYYRENRSVEHVAAALDLTEDAVKQRLARGRKLLQEHALALVEGALARTTPGRAFTLGVLAALPALMPTTAKAAGVGAGAAVAAHGGALAKTTALAVLVASVSGVVTTLMQLRVGLDQSRTDRERRAVVMATVGVFFGTLAFLGLLWALREAAFRWREHAAVLATLFQVLVVSFMVAWPFALYRMMAIFRRLRSAERLRCPELFVAARDRVGSSAGNYRSSLKLFGVPLVNVRFSSPDEGEGPVVGWIAVGDRAYGLLVAWGGVAIGPFSVGGFSVGILSIGAVSVGVIGLGTFASGMLAIGAIAVGLKAYAWLSALGWFTAQSGGFGVAWLAAQAPFAFAQHANDPVARALLTEPAGERNQMLFYTVIALATMVPMILYTRAVRRRVGPAARETAPREN